MDRAKLEEAIQRCKVAPVHYHPEKGLPPFWFMRQDLEALREAAEAHLATLPKTKIVVVWRVEFAQVKPNTLATWEAAAATFTDRDEADRYAKTVGKWPLTTCIRVTGPHQQEVPA